MPPTKPQDTPPNLLDLFKGMLDDHLGKAEFVKAFQSVIDYVKGFEKKLTSDFQSLAQALSGAATKLQSDFSQLSDQLRAQVNDVFVRDRLDALTSEQQAAIQRIDARIASVKDGEKGPKGDTGKQGRPGNDGAPDTPQAIRDKLEELKGDNRLDASAIKGLEDRLKKIEKQGPVYVGGSPGKGAVKAYDLSASLDGVTKTFALPAFWRVIMVQSSSFPTAFRQITDWTSDAAAMTITFTSAIDETSTLAAGQTIIIIYAEA